MKFSTIIGWIMVAAVTLFVFVNWTAPQKIYVLPWVSIDMPLSVAILAAAALGFFGASRMRMYKKEKKD